MTYLVTDNTTFLWSILLQPLLHCYNLSRFSQCYIAMTYLVTAIQPILYCYALSRYSQYYTAMIYSVTANTTLLWSIPSQPILHCYDLFCHSQYYIAMIYLTTVNTTLLWYNKRNTMIILIQQQLMLLYTTWYNSLWNMNTKADRILIYEQGDHPLLLENPTDAHTRSG